MRPMLLLLAITSIGASESFVQRCWASQFSGTANELRAVSFSDVSTWIAEGVSRTIHDIPKLMPQDELDDLTAIITMRSGEQYTGRVLCATDSVLVLWQSSGPYNSTILQSYGKSLHSSEIDRIAFESKGHFGPRVVEGLGGGFALGCALSLSFADDSNGDSTTSVSFAAIGNALLLGVAVAIPGALIFGILGAIQDIDETYDIEGDVEEYQAILPELRQRAMFPDQPPPELQSFVQTR